MATRHLALSLRSLRARPTPTFTSAILRSSLPVSRIPFTSTPLIASNSISTSASASRWNSNAAAARTQVDEDSWEAASLPAETTTPLETDPIIDTRLPFTSLERLISHDTLKALTFRPFQFKHMSDVQEQVLTLMPELIGVKLKEKDLRFRVKEGLEPESVLEGLGPDVRTEKIEVKGEEGQEWLKDESEIAEALKKRTAGEEEKLVKREDLLVKAKTGTGKTVAFLVPAIEARMRQLARESQWVDGNPEVKATPTQAGQTERHLARNTVGTLIISPTRELATQIANESIKLSTWHKLLETRLLVGGESRRNQIRDWRKGRLDFVVATPGRLKDLMQDEFEGPVIREALRRTDRLILDEADTLLDMGFSEDLNYIIGCLPKNRQTFLFSATVSKAIQRVAEKALDPNHRVIDCVPENESNVHEHIPQYATVLPTAKEQLPHVLKLLAHDQLTNPGKSKAIIFLPTTKQTQLFATLVREMAETLPVGQRTRVYEIHSKLTQDKRSRSSEMFRKDESGSSVLVTSDVSARGVDYPGVTRVIQIGVPHSADQYIHRVGRTGRGGKTGGRGDLVLLPWEGGFLKELHEVPIKEMGPDALEAEVRELAIGFDNGASEASAAPARPPKMDHRGRPMRQHIQTPLEPYLPRLDNQAQYIRDLQGKLDEEAVEEVFTSMIGYYVGKQDQLRLSAMTIVQGLQTWAVEAAGLEHPPYVSASFLAKLGVKKQQSGNGGGNRRGIGGFGFGGGNGGGSNAGFRPRFGGNGGARAPSTQFGGGGKPSFQRNGGGGPSWGGRGKQGGR